MKKLVRPKTTAEMLNEFESKLDELNSATDVKASDDWHGDEEYTSWIKKDTKPVKDFDGFMTEYSIWYNPLTDEWITLFGDTDIYNPSNHHADAEFGNDESAAWDWFEHYTTEDIESSTDIKAGMFSDGWYFGKEAAEQYGDLISKKLKGQTVSKRRDLARGPGGLIFESLRLGIDDFSDLLEALEGMCYEGRAEEIDDSTYLVL